MSNYSDFQEKLLTFDNNLRPALVDFIVEMRDWPDRLWGGYTATLLDEAMDKAGELRDLLDYMYQTASEDEADEQYNEDEDDDPGK